jgi:hypothetical protein
VPSVAYYHSLSLLGRSANVTVALPYGVGPLYEAARAWRFMASCRSQSACSRIQN